MTLDMARFFGMIQAVLLAEFFKEGGDHKGG